MTPHRFHRYRNGVAVTIAAMTAIVLSPVMAAAFSASSITPTTVVPTTTVVPEPAVSMELTQGTITFGDGQYRWVAGHGTVLDVDGAVTLDAGSVTFLFATHGGLVVSETPDGPLELVEGAATLRPGDAATTLGLIAGYPGSYETVDLVAGAAGEGDLAAFRPGAGPRTVTLSSVALPPGESYDVADVRHEFALVVVTDGVVEAWDGTKLYVHDTATTPAAEALVTNSSATHPATLLVAAIQPMTPPAPTTAVPTTIPPTTASDTTPNDP